MSAYYNEHDRFAAAWLRNLIGAGLIAPGVVDERDVQLLQPDDLRGFDQCHFFAGIGGWSYALRLAGWPDDRPVWTGSCPCQPFSSAGKGAGFDDPRHLWPTWFRLIRECRPAIVFGEQVASAAGLAWFDTVSTDLEAQAYAVGAADLCAAGVGAPHIRQRLFFVAHAGHVAMPDRSGASRGAARGAAGEVRDERLWLDPGPSGRGPIPMVDATGPRSARSADGGAASYASGARQGEGDQPAWRGEPAREGAADGRLVHSTGEGRSRRAEGPEAPGDGGTGAVEASATGRMGHAPGALADAGREGAARHAGKDEGAGREPGLELHDGGAHDGWRDLVWLPCRDGKARPAQPGILPLAHGVSNRLGTLRGAGNAIVPQVAAEFVAA